MRLKCLAPVLLAAAIVFPGCASSASSAQDISKLLAVTDVKTGWFDAGIENGMNKLVPTLILTLKNVSTTNVTQVQLNAVIRRTGEPDEWGGSYMKVIASEGLAAGASTKPIALRSNLGYTSTEPRAKMLTHKQFVDANIQLFAKYGGANWVKLGEYPVARQLLTE